MLDKKGKEKVIKKYQTHENDTGSSQVQIAVLTEEIKYLTKHLQIHKKDNSSRKGLIRKINERKKLLKYFQNENNEEFNKLVTSLKLKIGKKIQERKEEENKIDKDIEKEMEADKNKENDNNKEEKE